MSAKSFNKLLRNNPSMPRSLLKTSFYPTTESTEIESIEDEIERNIKHAIDLVSEHPFKTKILTTPEKEKIYLENAHYGDVKEIYISSGTEALTLINTLWESCSQR